MKQYQLINEPVRGTDPVQPSCVPVANTPAALLHPEPSSLEEEKIIIVAIVIVVIVIAIAIAIAIIIIRISISIATTRPYLMDGDFQVTPATCIMALRLIVADPYA